MKELIEQLKKGNEIKINISELPKLLFLLGAETNKNSFDLDYSELGKVKLKLK